MSQDINRVIIVGRLTRDVETKSTGNGGLIAKFSIASNRSEKRGDSWQDVPGFFDCVLFGKRADVLRQYAGKGKRLAIEGQLRWSSWEGSDGKKNSKVEIAVDQFQFLDAKQEGGSAASFDSGAMTEDEPDIPF